MKTKMKIYMLGLLSTLFIAGCTKDFKEINTDPNRTKNVPTINLISSAEKSLIDDTQDEWFSGRQGLLWSQYWSQRNYTSEDRFSIRQSVNSQYWTRIYTNIMDLEEIIKICNDPIKSQIIDASYGDAKGQIAVANVLKSYAFQMLVSTYGDIPYEEAFDAQNNPTPAYSTQKMIFLDLLKKLKASADYLVTVEEPVFSSGDLIYNGDAILWSKFANSLRLKIAIRLSKVTDAEIVAARNLAIAEAAGGAFTSNDDIAAIKYLGDGQSNAPMYDGFYTARRNDMTPSSQFVDLLKGLDDKLNNKVNPFNGLTDPRLSIWVPKAKGVYRGMPYGLEDKDASALRAFAANIYNAKNIVLHADATVILMDYAEVCFIQSELNNWDQTWYEDGITASLEYWGADAATYVPTVPLANKENVLTQKYIALYMNGYESWAEWRRTGYPKSIIQVGEKTGPTLNGTVITFSAIVGNAIPRRLTYPVREYTINETNVKAAAAAIGTDALSTPLIWDIAK